MDSFTYSNPTSILFGKGVVRDLGHEVGKVSDRVLLVYGGSSAKLNGSYADCMNSLIEHHIQVFELPGVQPNPLISKVREGVKICKDNGIGAVIALGGGSVIDCAKVICAGAKYSGDPWDFLCGKDGIETALPLFSVLTLAATGSEMDSGAVITNEVTHEKFDCAANCLFPKVAFEDPTYTFTVNKWQTASGTADIMSHVMEQYFGSTEEAYIQDEIACGIIKTCLKYGPIALNKPDDYEARAQLMWASSLALNGLVCAGHDFPWEVHPLEHPLSGFYNITHGAGLAVLTPAYLRYALNGKTVKRIAGFFAECFDIDGKDKTAQQVALEGIAELAGFFTGLGLPASLREFKIGPEKFALMAEQALKGNKSLGEFCPLAKEDIVAIYKAAY
jgi:alcohol dehydrogenase YqhD (iron-dependent ADH family)